MLKLSWSHDAMIPLEDQPHEHKVGVDVDGSVHVREDVGNEKPLCGANSEHCSHVLTILEHKNIDNQCQSVQCFWSIAVLSLPRRIYFSIPFPPKTFFVKIFLKI